MFAVPSVRVYRAELSGASYMYMYMYNVAMQPDFNVHSTLEQYKRVP